MKDYRTICKNLLGEDIFEELKKFEIYKPTTNTALDPRELEIAMQVVPRTILSFVSNCVAGMNNGDVREADIPFAPNSNWTINKHGPDDYNGEIRQDNKVKYTFKYRSIPGMAMLLMTSFELYDFNDAPVAEKQENPADNTIKLQEIIDERLKVYDLINNVVSNRMEIREARDQFINDKLNRILAHLEAQRDMDDQKNQKKELKLRRFLDAKKQPEPKKEFEISFEKSEKAVCGDCGSSLFDTDGWVSGCICSGDDRNKKVWLKKTENGVKLKFSKGWDPENINMLLQSLKRVKK
jgi:hypothetical protein